MDATPKRSDGELVRAAADGDDSSFRILYRAYVKPVFWLAYGLVGSTADAEEVTQETFLAAWRKLDGLILEGDSLLPWLATICRFQSANRMRRLARERAHTADAVSDTAAAPIDVEGDVIAAALAERILAEVATLSTLDREIFRLCTVEALGYAEAAAELGVDHGAVRNRLSRVRGRLRAVIDSEGA